MLVPPEETRLALHSCPNWTCILFFHLRVLSQPPQNTKKVRGQLLKVPMVTDMMCAHCRTEFFDKELCAAMYTHFNPACMHMSVLFPIRNFLKLRIKLSYTSFTSSAASITSLPCVTCNTLMLISPEENCLEKNLVGMETSGSTSVDCSDKTNRPPSHRIS